MFTTLSKNFGIWRENHTSQIGYPYKFLQLFTFSVFISSFILGLLVIVALKIKNDFFLIQSSRIELHAMPNSSNLFSNRNSAITLALITSDKGTQIIFDEGYSFIYPEHTDKIKKYLLTRKLNFEYTFLLAKTPIEFAKRAQIWPHREISFNTLQEILALLTLSGFDDFDIAVTKEGVKK